jgi:hypothetical protein
VLTGENLCVRGLLSGERPRLSNCLRVPYTLKPTRRGATFKRLIAATVPIGSTVQVKCRGKCKNVPRCRQFQRRKSLSLTRRGRRISMRRGSTLEVRVFKPDTLGLISRIKLPRRGSSSQTYGYLAAGAQPPRPCPDA